MITDQHGAALFSLHQQACLVHLPRLHNVLPLYSSFSGQCRLGFAHPKRCWEKVESWQCWLPHCEHQSLQVSLMALTPFFFFPTWNLWGSQKTCCRVNECCEICSNLENKRIHKELTMVRQKTKSASWLRWKVKNAPGKQKWEERRRQRHLNPLTRSIILNSSTQLLFCNVSWLAN